MMSAQNEKQSLLPNSKQNNVDVEVNTADEEGLSTFKCGVFIFTCVAGSGVLALPNALSNSGWAGVILLVCTCLLCVYCGVAIGKCWIIVQKNKQVSDPSRDPFPVIGQAAAGKQGYYFTEVSVIISCMGASIVFLILGAQQMSALSETSFKGFTETNELQIWILICGLALLPFQWLGSAKEMFSFILIASLCTVVASFLIIARSAIVWQTFGLPDPSTYRKVTTNSFFTAFGTIAFTFGGGTLFPTFQAQMKEPSKFVYSLGIGFGGVFCVYLPAAVLPFLIISQPDTDVMISLRQLPGNGKPLIIVAQCLLSFHILSTIVLVNNAISLQFEKHLGMTHRFGWKRVLVRTCVAFVLMGIALLFPHLGPVLTIVGASTVTIVSFILPAWFYLKLNDHCVPLHIKVLHAEIIIVAIFCGCLGIYSGVADLAKTAF